MCSLAARELAPVSRRERLLGARAMPRQRPGGWRCWISNAVGRVTPCVARLTRNSQREQSLLRRRCCVFRRESMRAAIAGLCTTRFQLLLFPELLGVRYTAFTAAAPASHFHAMLPAKSPRSLLNVIRPFARKRLETGFFRLKKMKKTRMCLPSASIVEFFATSSIDSSQRCCVIDFSQCCV